MALQTKVKEDKTMSKLKELVESGVAAMSNMGGAHKAFDGGETTFLDIVPDPMGSHATNELCWLDGGQPHDRRVTLKYYGEADVEEDERLAEKLVACAVMRDWEGLPPSSLRIRGDIGTCGGSGRYVHPDSAARVSLASAAWDALMMDTPYAHEMEAARHIHNRYSLAWRMCKGLVLLPEDHAASWMLCETMKILSPHYAFIKRTGKMLMHQKTLNPREIEGLIREYMTEMIMDQPHLFDNCGVVPYSLKAA